MHGNMPPNPVYSNFKEYLNGDAETLVKDPNVHKEKRGRKPNDAQIDKIIEEIQDRDRKAPAGNH